MTEPAPNSNGVSEQPEVYSFPMSFAQQRLWIVERLAKGVAAYNLPVVYRLRGALSVVALETALQGLVDRHESLRTTFTSESGTLLQNIHSWLSVELDIFDLSGRDEIDANTRQEELIREEVRRPFNLQSGPIFRPILIKRREAEHILILNVHHIVSDGFSSEIIDRNLSELYNAAVMERQPVLPPLPIQYADFSEWQRQWLTGDVLTRQMEYWRGQLKELPLLQLQTDFARPSVQTFYGASVDCEIPPQVSAALRSIGMRVRATTFMTLLTGFHVLLTRLTGQDDIAIGSPFANRNRPELAEVVGFFVNTLVLRNKLERGDSFISVLSQVRDVVLDALSHQDLPFEKLVEELVQGRDTGRNPLFQVMFSLQGAGVRPLTMNGMQAEALRVATSIAKVDLTLFVKESDETFVCTLNYNTDLFTELTAQSILRHFQNLLADIAQRPDRSISALRMLGDADEHRIVREWNDTETEYPRDATLITLFSSQAQRTPDAIAVRDEHSELSYSELERRSNQLAHHLIECGVKPDQLIGLAVSRSANMLIGVLGIIKAGGAYLPIDAGYPPERQLFMLEDANVEIVISESSQLANLAVGDRHLIDLVGDKRTIESQQHSLPKISLDSENLAYVIYTSGSTGTPKGVCITHRAVARLVLNTNYVSLKEGDRIGQLANICFDAATFELWGAMLSGASLEIIPTDVLLSPESFAENLARKMVDVLFVTTALFNQFVRYSPALFANVRTVMFGGESVDVESVRKVLAAGCPQQLLHVYGPTECTTFATSHEVTQADAESSTIPIGKPISNTCAYILDQQLNAAPEGIVGELYLGGDGLAREYLNRPDLTAEQFVANPFADDEKLYRTGDLARYRPDGAIEFIGRLDNQIKIRGYRIEPGEIETQLDQNDGIESSLVLLDDNNSGEKRLVAYVVPVEFDSFVPGGVRDYLKARLPEFMLPAFIIPVRTWPLNQSGKIDRFALSKVTETGSTTVAARMPKTQTELHLCKIWEHVLDVDHVGITDNFFDLGGHSLLAVTMFNAVERLFGKVIPMDTLWFDGGTIESLARVLEQDQSIVKWPTLVEMQAHGALQPLFFVHTMGGNLFHYDDLVSELGPDQPVYGLQARGVYGSEKARSSLESIAADCIEAMKRRQAFGPYLIVGFSSAGVVAYEMAQQLYRSGEPPSQIILIDAFAAEVERIVRIKHTLMRLIRANSLRDFQERLYHLVLHNLGLSRFRSFAQIGEAHRWAHWSYVPSPYPGPVHLFVAEENQRHQENPEQLWEPRLGNQLVTEVIPGTHGSMVRHPHVKILATKIKKLVAQSTSECKRV